MSMYPIVLALISGASANDPQVQGIHCNSDGHCPWYCVGCACCSGTCWFGAGLVQCRNEECEICKDTANAVLDMGGEGGCDVGASAACMAAGGAFLDPIADAICPVICGELCNYIWGQATKPTAQQACEHLGMCSSGLNIAVRAARNGRFVDQTGRQLGYAYAVCASQDVDWQWEEDAEDTDPHCATYTADTHGCDTEWMKQNCAGTCRRCPGAGTGVLRSEGM